MTVDGLLEGFKSPLLLLWGELDPWIRPAAADKIQASCSIAVTPTPVFRYKLQYESRPSQRRGISEFQARHSISFEGILGCRDYPGWSVRTQTSPGASAPDVFCAFSPDFSSDCSSDRSACSRRCTRRRSASACRQATGKFARHQIIVHCSAHFAAHGSHAIEGIESRPVVCCAFSASCRFMYRIFSRFFTISCELLYIFDTVFE